MPEPQTPDPSPVPEEKISLSLSDIKTLIKEAVTEATTPLMEMNQRLQSEVTNNGGRIIDPSHLEAAMSVTIATRPVLENPGQYKKVIDPSGLSVNTASPLSPKNFADCFVEPNGTV